MSYDVSIDVPSGPTHTVEAFWQNYTSNCSWMWTECLALPEKPRANGRGNDYGLRLLNGAPCSEAAGILADAVERMKTKGDEYRPKNPENGWGDYDTALDFLAAIAQAAADHPLGVIRVCA